VGAHLTGERAAAGPCKSAYDDNGAAGEADDLLSDAPEKKAGQPAMTPAADDDQVGLVIPGCRNDLRGRVAERRLDRDLRGALRERLLASIIENIIGHREDELCRGCRHMFRARIFLHRSIELGQAISGNLQQDKLGIVFARQISCEIDSFERGRRTVDPDQNTFHGYAPTPRTIWLI